MVFLKLLHSLTTPTVSLFSIIVNFTSQNFHESSRHSLPFVFHALLYNHIIKNIRWIFTCLEKECIHLSKALLPVPFAFVMDHRWIRSAYHLAVTENFRNWVKELLQSQEEFLVIRSNTSRENILLTDIKEN